MNIWVASCFITGVVGIGTFIIGIAMLTVPDVFPEHGRQAMAIFGLLTGLTGVVLMMCLGKHGNEG